MHSRKTVLIVDLMNAANMELIRLDFRSSTETEKYSATIIDTQSA